MLHSFFQAICRVGIFMICAQAILHFRAQEAYEKYLKLLVSIMILIQLFLPIGSLLLGRDGQNVAEGLEQLKEDMERSLREAEENAAAADELLGRMTLEEVRDLMEAQKEVGRQTEVGDGEEAEEGIAIESIEIDVEAIEPISIESISVESASTNG